MNRRTLGPLSLALATLTVACSTDGTGPSGGPTEAEAGAIATVVTQQALTDAEAIAAEAAAQNVDGRAPSPVGTAPIRGPLRRASVEVPREGSVTISCPVGGSLTTEQSIAGSADPLTGESDLDITLVLVHDACAVQPEELDEVLILTGAPGLDSTLSLARTASSGLEISGSITGAVDWTLGGRGGRCEVVLSVSADAGPGEGLTSSLTGSVCGIAVSEEISNQPVA